METDLIFQVPFGGSQESGGSRNNAKCLLCSPRKSSPSHDNGSSEARARARGKAYFKSQRAPIPGNSRGPRVFKVPKINLDAASYIDLISWQENILNPRYYAMLRMNFSLRWWSQGAILK